MFSLLKRLFQRKQRKLTCGRCRLYDRGRGVCRVAVIHDGEKINIPVEPKDDCFFEQTYLDPETGTLETFNDVQEIRFWVENEKGERIDGNGTVKVQFNADLLPEGDYNELSSNSVLDEEVTEPDRRRAPRAE
jgi:hypothetical protein